MPTREKQWWEGDLRWGTQHPAAKTYAYEAYCPDLLAGESWEVPSDLVAELEATSVAVAELQGLAPASGLEALSRQLLRGESLGSSKIEGHQLSQRRLARADLDPDAAKALARLVMGNVKAMEVAIALATEADPLNTASLLAIHRALFEEVEGAKGAGQLRRVANWIGGSSHGPWQAEFVPPPWPKVPELLDDLSAFLARTDLPALLQAALAHAQFETIHPFEDGNGRVGRALIHAVLRRRGVAPHHVPPVSLVLAGNPERYVAGLNAFRQGDPWAWCHTFLGCLQSAAEQAKALHLALETLQARWQESSGHPRQGSAERRLLQLLPSHPALNGKKAEALLGVSKQAVNSALNRLEEAGVLKQVSVGRRNRVWEATELLQLLDAFEWQLATPTQSIGEGKQPLG